jgi:hypothetical protein
MDTKRRGKCINFGNCPKADRDEIIELDFTEDFVCPECNDELEERASTSGGGLSKGLIMGIVAAVVVLGGIAAYFLLSSGVAAVKELKLSETQFTLTVGDTHRLTYTVEPAGAPAEGLVWKSSDEAVASVSNGTVTAVAPGEAQITLSMPDNLKVSGKSTVKVLPPPGNDADVAEALKNGVVQGDANGVGRISTPWGNYNGDLKNGKADGNGTFEFFKDGLISRKDPTKREGKAGDFITGQFAGNEVVQVTWLDNQKNQKDVIIIGSTGLKPGN